MRIRETFPQPAKANIIMDITYFERSFGVMVLMDSISGQVLSVREVKHETNALYTEALNDLREKGVVIQSIVCDGRKGLLQLFPEIPAQLCQSHQVKTVSLIEPGPIKSNFRGNSFQQFRQWIDLDNSRHKERYLAMTNRLQSDKPLPFTLPPEAVVQKLIHAIESPRPKARYYVTALTWLMGTAKRLLPTFLLDKLILWLAARENKRYQ